MKKQQCPICFEELEVRDVAPCWECGGFPEEIEHLLNGNHTYTEYEVFGSKIVFCDFCYVDSASYAPTFLGLPSATDMRFVFDSYREIKRLYDPEVAKDWFCKNCNSRLKYLNWLIEIREKNSTWKE